MQDKQYLLISTATETFRFSEEMIVCITSDGNYSNINAVGGETFVVLLQLGQVEQLIADQLSSPRGSFIRIGRGLIINIRYLSYISIPRQKVYLLDTSGRKYMQSASREALIQLKKLTDNRK